MTTVGLIFFLVMSHQHSHTKKKFSAFGKMPSSVSCRTNALSFVNVTWSAVVMLIHVAATAPMTMVPTMTMELRSAADCGPTSASTAAPPMV